MAVPVEATAVAGATILAASWNDDVRDAVNFLTNVPQCKMYGSADWMNWAVTATLYSTTWNTEAYNTDTMHSTGANTQRITFNTAGVYEINLNMRVNSPAWNANNRIAAEARLNAGATVIWDANANPMDTAANFTFNRIWSYKFAAADYIDIYSGYLGTSVGGINPALQSGQAYSTLTARWTGTGA